MKSWRFLIASSLAAGLIPLHAALAQTDTGAAQKVETQDTQIQTGSTTKPSEAAESQQGADVIALADWAYEPLYADGWSVEELIDEADAYGAEGEEIGDIENLLIGENGKILAVILEMGGFFDLGDTHIMVPWEEVEVAPGLERITVPVNQENAEEYSMYGGRSLISKQDTQDKQVIFEKIATGPRVWQASELLNDFAVLEGSVGYGYVDDLLFNRSGDLKAVVVTADSIYGPGAYAYPFYGYAHGFDPGAAYYDLGYPEADVAQLEEFDTEKVED